MTGEMSMVDKGITQEELQGLLETRAGQSALIQLVLSLQHELHHTLRELESNAHWARRNAEQSVEWVRGQARHAADSGDE